VKIIEPKPDGYASDERAIIGCVRSTFETPFLAIEVMRSVSHHQLFAPFAESPPVAA